MANTGDIQRLIKALGDAHKKLPIEFAAAVNATAKKATTAAARALAKELPVPVRILKKAIKTKQKASPGKPAIIRLWEGHPIPLKYFAAKQTKTGVTYKLKRANKRRSIMRSAFIPQAYGGNVYIRKTASRGPLEQIYGPSPGEAYKDAGVEAIVVKVATEELPKQIERRVRLVLLRAQGIVGQRKGR